MPDDRFPGDIHFENILTLAQTDQDELPGKPSRPHRAVFADLEKQTPLKMSLF